MECPKCKEYYQVAAVTEKGNICLDCYSKNESLKKYMERDSIIEMLEEMKKKETCNPMHTPIKQGGITVCHQCSMFGGHDSALEQVIDKIKQL